VQQTARVKNVLSSQWINRDKNIELLAVEKHNLSAR
jgi:hypothetical protein